MSTPPCPAPPQPGPSNYFSSTPTSIIPFPATSAATVLPPTSASSSSVPTAPPPTRSWKRKNALSSLTSTPTPAKKQAVLRPSSTSATSMIAVGTTETICGTGPTTVPAKSTSVPTQSVEMTAEVTPTVSTELNGHQYAQKLLKRRGTTKRSATDVWFFVEPLKADAQPPLEGIIGPDISTMKVILDSKPDPKKYPQLCWKTWSNCDGVTGTVRTHLKDPTIPQHLLIYQGIMKFLGLKHNDDKVPQDTPQEQFTTEAWLDRLVRWIVVDDQSLNVVDVSEFREFVLFGRGDIAKTQLPHWSALTDLIAASYKKHHDELKTLLKSSLGHVSLTADIWSDTNLRVFLALTSFWIVEGAHDGDHLGDIIFTIWKEAGLLHITVLKELEENPTEPIQEYISTLPFDSTADIEEAEAYVVALEAKLVTVRATLHLIRDLLGSTTKAG
ncbi:hypothetical protein H0H81_011918 [Sphagnurus paluster]|uniref:Uncharacterized protein n=1 Tax=Sphagnurus paluster TaxID=117069 RepID=A0A9P7G0L1_9AGAR|nr:hypothetical protein H0H81_011918 [Sphagnurus paluster]